MNELPTQHALTAYMYLACWEGILHVERAYCTLRGHIASWEGILHVGRSSCMLGRPPCMLGGLRMLISGCQELR